MPTFSEVNFFDALLETLNRMRDVNGRKAIILVSSGIDTFSKANYQLVLEASRASATPIYTIGPFILCSGSPQYMGDRAVCAH